MDGINPALPSGFRALNSGNYGIWEAKGLGFRGYC